MAKKKKTSNSKLRMFYLDGQLLKTIKIDRANDLVYVWSFTENRQQCYVLSDALRRMQNAFTITQVAQMIRRHRMRVVEYLDNEAIRRPQRAKNLKTGNPGRHYFSEDDVFELHDHFASLHRGRPRNDGIVIPQDMPSKKELAAMMRHDTSLFVKDEDGNYIPVWRERYI